MEILEKIKRIYSGNATGSTADDLEAYLVEECGANIVISGGITNTPTTPIFVVTSDRIESAKAYLKRLIRHSPQKNVFRVGSYYYAFSDRDGIKIST